MKRLYCVLIHRAVEIIGAGAGRAGLVVTRLSPDDRSRSMDVAMNDRRDGIEKGERLFSPVTGLDGHWQVAPRSMGPVAMTTLPQSCGRQARRLSLAVERDQRVAGDRLASSPCEKPVRSTASAPPAGRACLSAMLHDQRPGAAQLLMQKTDGVALRVVGTKTVGAHELRESVRDMCAGEAFVGPHLVQNDGNAAIVPPARRLPIRRDRRRSREVLRRGDICHLAADIKCCSSVSSETGVSESRTEMRQSRKPRAIA